MTTSILTTSAGDLISRVITKLTTAGYVYDPLTTSFERYLATTLGALTGGIDLHLTRSGPRLLSELLVALGGVGDFLTTSSLQLMANLIDLESGPVGTATPVGLLLALTRDT